MANFTICPEIVVHHIKALVGEETHHWRIGQGLIRDKTITELYKFVEALVVYPYEPGIIPDIIEFAVSIGINKDFWYCHKNQPDSIELVLYKGKE